MLFKLTFLLYMADIYSEQRVEREFSARYQGAWAKGEAAKRPTGVMPGPEPDPPRHMILLAICLPQYLGRFPILSLNLLR